MTTSPLPPRPQPEPSAPASPSPPGGGNRQGLKVAGRVGLALAMVVVLGTSLWTLALLTRPRPEPRERSAEVLVPEVTPANVEPGSVIPAVVVLPVPQGAPGRDVIGEWAARAADALDVPARALRAYATTDLLLRLEAPRCRLTWTTLAGIGRIESNHGQFAGARLDDDGRPSRRIIGIPLDGSPGVAEIADTDGGHLDGDTTHDRAVGPMQFIPSTWSRWAADGDGDRQSDPHDLDDAALAAGRYLCAHNRDTGTPEGWWDAVLSYNHSVEYAQRVFTVADTYAQTPQAN
jgi:hypothetical protein